MGLQQTWAFAELSEHIRAQLYEAAGEGDYLIYSRCGALLGPSY